jgi:hypothetical protein
MFDPEAETASHHFREYTKAEIVDCLRKANLRLIRHTYANYFSYDSALKSLFHRLSAVIPPFRNGQTFVIAKG